MKTMIKFNLILLMVGTSLATLICSYFLKIGMNNFEQYLGVALVIFADGFFGIWRSLKCGEFETKKALKIPKILAFWIGILTLILIIESAFTGTGWLSEAVLIPFIVFQLISILKNATQLNLIQNELVTKILEKLDRHKDFKI